MKQKMLLSLPIGMSLRNLLLSGVYCELNKKYDVFLITTLNDRDFCQSLAPESTIFIYPPVNKIKGYIRSIFKKIDYFYFWIIHKPKTIEKYILKLKEDSKITYLLSSFVVKFWKRVIENSKLRKGILFFYLESNYTSLLVLNDIELVFIPTIDVQEDIILSNCANNIGIPLIALVHSWDNLPSRGSILFSPDLLLVWNYIMRDQAIEFHGIDSDTIKVVGIPQYDFYKKNIQISTRHVFFKKNNLIEYDKVITYTCVAKHVFPDEEKFIFNLYNLVHQGTFGNCLLIIRLHPTERTEYYEIILKNKNDIYVDIPDSLFAATYSDIHDIKGVENFVNLLYHSDIIINLASTITIDAAVFDTPVINIGYNIELPDSSWNSAEKWYHSTHFRNIIKTGGTALVFSEQELIITIKKYLENPKLHQQERNRIVEEQCYKIDGKTTQRIVKSIEETNILNQKNRSGLKRGKTKKTT